VQKAGQPDAACTTKSPDGRPCVARVQRYYMRQKQKGWLRSAFVFSCDCWAGTSTRGSIVATGSTCLCGSSTASRRRILMSSACRRWHILLPLGVSAGCRAGAFPAVADV